MSTRIERDLQRTEEFETGKEYIHSQLILVQRNIRERCGSIMLSGDTQTSVVQIVVEEIRSFFDSGLSAGYFLREDIMGLELDIKYEEVRSASISIDPYISSISLQEQHITPFVLEAYTRKFNIVNFNREVTRSIRGA